MPTIYVVGCDHAVQSADPVPFLLDSAAVNVQRDHLCRTVERMLSDKKVELVAEEWGRPSESFAQVLSRKYRIRYVDINTSFEDLDALKIPRDYINPIKYTKEQIEGWLQKRERFMLDKIHKSRETAKMVLVICGLDHLEPLAEQLVDRERVIPVDYRNEDWYRGDVFFPVSP